MGRILLQRLATGATGVKQARYRRGSTRGSEALVRACAVYTQPVYRNFVYSVPLKVLGTETTHGVYEFRRGFCTLVLSLFFSFNPCNSKTVNGTGLKLCTQVGYHDGSCNGMLIF